jgi:two-component sensor histidine kinase
MDQLLSADELVREAQHRVKNSLQLVASMLSAQARRSGDAALVAGLRDAASRIVAVAHLHENLQNQTEQVVRVDDYLRDICRDVALTAGRDRDRAGVQVHAVDVRLPGPNALALGLVANELVTNALRHAYPTGSGPVEVTLTQDKGQVVLTVADKGVGRFGAGEGLGLSFVRLLAQKLQAELEISDAAPGTQVSVTFLADRAKDAGLGEATFIDQADGARRDDSTSRAWSQAGPSPSLRRPELRVE